MNTASVLRIGELAKENQQLREQLAAERERVKGLEHDLRRMQGLTTDKRVDQLQAQLSAEREKAEALQEQVNIRGEMRDEAIAEMTDALKQLAAEREKREGDMKELRILTHATIDRLAKENEQLREQLAAEQGNHEAQLIDNDEQWQRKLAAEREDRISWQELYEKTNDQLSAEREKVKRKEQEIDAYNKALAAERSKVAELTEQNKTFRAAQKACEDCDGPTMAEVQQMREQVKLLEEELNEAVKLLKLADIDAAIAKVRK